MSKYRHAVGTRRDISRRYALFLFIVKLVDLFFSTCFATGCIYYFGEIKIFIYKVAKNKTTMFDHRCKNVFTFLFINGILFTFFMFFIFTFFIFKNIRKWHTHITKQHIKVTFSFVMR